MPGRRPGSTRCWRSSTFRRRPEGRRTHLQSRKKRPPSSGRPVVIVGAEASAFASTPMSARRFSLEQNAAGLDEIKTGKSYAVIARRLRVSPSYVGRIARTILRMHRIRGPLKKRLTPEQQQSLLDAVRSGASVRQLAQEYDVDDSSVYAFAKGIRRGPKLLTPEERLSGRVDLARRELFYKRQRRSY